MRVAIDLTRVRPCDVVLIEGRVSGQGVMGGAEPRVTVTLLGGGEYVIPAKAIVSHAEALEIGARVRWDLVEGELIAVRGEWGVVAPDVGAPVSVLLSELKGID